MSTREDAERRYAQIEGERDYHKRRAERLEAERDALAAHVEQMTDAACSEGAGPKMRAAIDEGPTTSLARQKLLWQAEALRAFAEQQRAALEAIPVRDRYALHPGTSVDGWHHTFAQRADAAADEIDGQAEGGDT